MSFYKQAIIDAITDLKDRNGSSMVSIKKIVQDKIPKDKKWLNGTFLLILKTGVVKGDFIKVKVRNFLIPSTSGISF
jgi:linker histone H1 and H5 family